MKKGTSNVIKETNLDSRGSDEPLPQNPSFPGACSSSTLLK